MLYISAAIKPDFARGLFFSDSINLISKEKESKHSSKRDLFLKILEIITVFFVFFKNPPPFNKTQKIKFITTNWNQPFEVFNLLLLHANNQCWMPLHLTTICSQHYWNIIINIAHEYILHISLQKKTMWCSLLFLSQDKKMNRQSTDFPLLSTVYKMYTYMHVLTSVSSYMALYYPVSIFSMVWIIMRTYLIINMN